MAGTTCPHCQNTFGFVFGTCTDCGFNYITEEFTHVRVYVKDLPKGLRDVLITEHKYRTKRDAKTD
jgi:hypothetical protein